MSVDDATAAMAAVSLTKLDDGEWTEEERTTCLAVRDALIKEHGLKPSQVGEVELVTITLCSKLRVDEAVQKFLTYHNQLLGEYNIPDVWADHAELEDQWYRLAVAGRDEGSRGIMWINGGGTAIEDEAKCIRSCCLYYFAVHADRHTMRNGISLVINTANAPKKKIGNERKLQVAWQNFPTRAQGIYILGTNAITRIAINALIAFAALFAKNKVIARVRFADLKELVKKFGQPNVPEPHGGEKRVPTGQWVKERLASFPKMGLPDYV